MISNLNVESHYHLDEKKILNLEVGRPGYLICVMNFKHNEFHGFGLVQKYLGSLEIYYCSMFICWIISML